MVLTNSWTFIRETSFNLLFSLVFWRKEKTILLNRAINCSYIFVYCVRCSCTSHKMVFLDIKNDPTWKCPSDLTFAHGGKGKLGVFFVPQNLQSLVPVMAVQKHKNTIMDS